MGKIVAISDLHLGQNGADGRGQYSLLSSRVPSNRIQALAEAVKSFAAGDRVTLVIVGDMLDLSLAYMAEALDDLKHLLKTLPIDALTCVIGNHDHHLWTLHSEDQRLLQPLRDGKVPPLDLTNPSAMSMYQPTGLSGEPFALLQGLVSACHPGTSIQIAYPSYSQQAGQTLLYFTHSHLFAGSLYTATSDLLADRLKGLPHADACAIANQAVIEFVYWSLGETGLGLGADGLMEQIYTDLQKGKDSQLAALIKRAVALEAPSGFLPIIPAKWQQNAIDKLLIDKLNAYAANPATASAAAAARYEDVQVTRAQLVAWIAADELLSNAAKSSEKVCFAYGHTHVWDCYAVPSTGITAWNLNTWLVEPDHPMPRTGFLGIDQADGSAAWIDVLPLRVMP